MMVSKKWICIFFLLVINTQLAIASQLSHTITVNVDDKAQLQRGAKLFMNYCSGCHSLKYMRYSRMAQDLGLVTSNGRIDEDLLQKNLVFTDSSTTETIQVAMPLEDAKKWFGVSPPDLSLTAREKGTGWVYTYLMGFYTDKSRPFGVNNQVIPNVAMPNCLEPLIKNMNYHTSRQWIEAVEDITTFLAYVSEPSQLIRYQLGAYVIVFLALFFIVVYLLKKAYWKSIRH